MKITIENLHLRYGKFTAIDNLNLKIGEGESVVLLGKSGCGKTSTMRCIAGLEEPTSGRITIGDTVVFDAERGISLPPNKRNVGMVFQSYAVWPHMTVFQNVAYALKVQKLPSSEVRSRVDEVLELVGLSDFAQRGASLLSGGQMQRVALARSLVMRPSVLMLDEPLSNLDARLRDRLRVELREIQLQLGLTTVYVTHDQQEAFALADRIALMQGGRIVQIGGPTDIYHGPASASIAYFLGVSNVLDCTARTGSDGYVVATVTSSGTTVPTRQRSLPAGDLRVCVRSEDLVISSTPTRGDGGEFAGSIAVTSFQGASVRYTVTLDGGADLDVFSPAKGSTPYAIGDRVYVSVAPENVQILPAEVTHDVSDASGEGVAA
ncbi:ABC transporter ATP-binding protein [Terrabacter sp. Ter38]|uniref:ABC transporter ATP-binding protein n=1 Tax=Terrabacter sp. Ter38 TaxID=2926030 RepID=UPI0021183215|nr:ABC transporter ATP-binding protein [Terrabacter sp. Ter38]